MKFKPGLGFDGNLLGSPLTRKFLALWMEAAGRSVMVLPQVQKELLSGPPNPTPKQQQMNRMFAESWWRMWRDESSMYIPVTMDVPSRERFHDYIGDFTMACFPNAPSVGELSAHPDAIMLAEGMATGTDMVVTNDITTIRHREVNALAMRAWGKNTELVMTGDAALLATHDHGDGLRQMLALFMAATWPRPVKSLPIETHAERMMALAPKLAAGARMPEVADELTTTFDVDEDLHSIIDAAQDLAENSIALALDDERERIVSRGLNAIGRGGGGRGRRQDGHGAMRNAVLKSSRTVQGANADAESPPNRHRD